MLNVLSDSMLNNAACERSLSKPTDIEVPDKTRPLREVLRATNPYAPQ